MSFEDEEESFEHTLLVVREVFIYKIPPRSTSGGYKCGEWLLSDKIWSGRLRVVSCKDRCEIRLEDPNSGELFAACFVHPGKRDNSVEPALDSSRYFVLKIEDGTGKHAFIGLGFNERNEAFDFNVALSDHDKYIKREEDGGSSSSDSSDENHIGIHPAVNHRLKEGETIRITVKNKPASGTGMLSAASVSGPAGKAKPLGLAPPPVTGVKIRSPLPPPPNNDAARKVSGGAVPKPPAETPKNSTDAFSDFSQLRMDLPSSTGSSTKTGAAGWAAF